MTLRFNKQLDSGFEVYVTPYVKLTQYCISATVYRAHTRSSGFFYTLFTHKKSKTPTNIRLFSSVTKGKISIDPHVKWLCIRHRYYHQLRSAVMETWYQPSFEPLVRQLTSQEPPKCESPTGVVIVNLYTHFYNALPNTDALLPHPACTYSQFPFFNILTDLIFIF